MHFIARLILQIFSNALAIFLANKFVSGFLFSGDLKALIFAGLVLALINIFIRPVLKLFLGPFIVLSFGLLLFVLNAFLLYLLDLFLGTLTIEGYIALFYASLLIGLVNFVIGLGGKATEKKEK